MKVEYLHDSFVDFEGKTHYFCIAAVSEELPTENECGKPLDYMVLECTDTQEEVLAYLYKTLRIGLSICNPSDEYNPNIGATIAFNKAMNSDPVIWSTEKGIIGSESVSGILRQRAAYVKDNPGVFITGYKDKERKFKEEIAMTELHNSLSKSVKKAVSEFIANPNLLESVNKLVKWTKRLEY